MESLKIKSIPTSFVFSNLKPVNDKGAGEAKLFVGPKSKASEYDNFFDYEGDYVYKFDKQNLLDYLKQVKIEYVYQKFNKYKNASIETWKVNYSAIEDLSDEAFRIALKKYEDEARYYIRADEPIFRKWFRYIAVPKITDLLIEKDPDNKEITFLLDLNLDFQSSELEVQDEERKAIIGKNILLYGVPGCGKSYYIKQEYCDDENYMERVVFHPDYTYSDFIGQILPESTVNQNGEQHISYPFVPGPFTRILEKAENDQNNNYYLIIEEINRGNAPAIFGEVFQLLDRIDGVSEYGINNTDIAQFVYKNAEHPVKIPRNLFILATMNTADQNVFTLDTAFKRRWQMQSIPNDIDGCEFADNEICGSNVSWKDFVSVINDEIIEVNEGNIGNEDKRIGAYFAKLTELQDTSLFGEKVLMYLWNDAFRYDHEKVFKSEYRTLEQLLAGFNRIKFGVFKDSIEFKTIPASPAVDSGSSLDSFGRTKITGFVFAGKRTEVNTYADMTRIMMQKLYNEHSDIIERLANDNYKMTGTDKVFIAEDEAVIRGIAEHIPGSNVYYDIKLSSDNCVRLIESVLRECGIEPGTEFRIETED